MDLAAKYPQKVKELAALWLDEAKKNQVLPLNDLSLPELHKIEYRAAIPPDGRYTYYPGTTEIPEASAAGHSPHTLKSARRSLKGETAKSSSVSRRASLSNLSRSPAV